MARLVASAVWTALCVALVAALVRDHRRQCRAHVDEELRLLGSRVDATVRNLGQFSRYAWESAVVQPRVTALLRRAWHAGEAERAPLRRELHRLMLPQYERMTRFHFRQLHFHFPDNTSFLRMHSPAEFGDDLTAVRATVRLANERRRPVMGFEEGRIFNGYRFVYPLFDGGEHVGSVEVSFSMESFLEVLAGLDDARHVFAIDRSVVESVVFAHHRDHYVDSPISPRLMHDRSALGGGMDAAVFRSLGPGLEARLDEGRDFGFARSEGGGGLRALFRAVGNLEGKTVGWIVSVAPDGTVARLEADLRRVVALTLLAWAALMVASWIFLTDRQKLAILSATDPLTGIMNRRSFIERAQREMAAARDSGAPLGLVLLDVDHFKAFNDTWGHNEGDRVLAGTAAAASRLIRSGDLLARWGGEELMVLLPRCGLDAALRVAEKLRAGIAEAPLSPHQPVTVSLGVTVYAVGETFEAFVGRADAALYEAKAGGRNRAVART